MLTLRAIREAVEARADWSPRGSPDFDRQFLQWVNLTLAELAARMPQHFAESMATLRVDPEHASASADDRLDVLKANDYGADSYANQTSWAGNDWVLRTTYQRNQDIGPTTPWRHDRTWDGRTLVLTDVNGEVFRTRIRTVWKVTINKADPAPAGADPAAPATWEEFRVTVLNPVPDHLEGPFEWRVIQDTLTVPDDFVQIKNIDLLDDTLGQAFRIPIHSSFEMDRRLAHPENNLQATNGPGQVVYPLPTQRIMSPSTKPLVATSSANWLGPEPYGTFEYAVTYVWGKTDNDAVGPGVGNFSISPGTYDPSNINSPALAPSRNRARIPLWESAPSPVSDVATVRVTPSGGDGAPEVAAKGVDITLPNIEYVLGFLLSGVGASMTPNHTFFRQSTARSGWSVRIYRRRLTEDYSGYDTLGASRPGQHVPALKRLDIKSEFHLLAEVRIDPGNEGIFTDNGTILPDVNRPLRSSGSHRTFAVSPPPAYPVKLRIRYVAEPQALRDDQDAAPVQAAIADVIVSRVLMHLHEKTKNTEAWRISRNEFNEALQRASSIADMRPKSRIVKKRPARSRNRSLTFTDWRRDND